MSTLPIVAAFACVLCIPTTVFANDVKLTIRSLPEGASVFTVQPNGVERLWGAGPITLKWQVPRRWTQCITTESVKVRWVSGVEATVSGVELCPSTGKNQQFVFQRPTEAPGVELDVQYAMALMQSAAAAAAAQEQARAATTAAILSAFAPPPRAKICTSNIVGSQIFTYCY